MMPVMSPRAVTSASVRLPPATTAFAGGVVYSAEPDWRTEFFLLRQEVEQLKANDVCQSQDIQSLRRQVGGEIVALSDRLAIIEGSPWIHRMKQAEANISAAVIAINDISTAVTGINDLAIRVEALEAGPEESDLERHVREIDARGNVRFDLMSGRMQVLREIAFVPLKSSDQPIATLRDPQVAAEVIDDIAAIAALFEGDVLTIEGHTGGGDNEFWQQLANDRARLVGQEIVNRGHQADKVKTIGKPGKTGLNKSEVIVKLAMTPEEIEAMRAHVIARRGGKA